jgi:Glycosyl transferase family 2
MLPSIEVIACISNPAQYKSRYKLYKLFADDLKQQSIKVRLWTIELAHGAYPMKVTQSDNENHIQLWTSGLPGLIWYKENLINLAINHVISRAPDTRYIAWVDADFKFEPNAFAKTVAALQHYDIVQMWSHLINFDPKGGILNNGVGISFMYAYMNGIQNQNTSAYEQGCGSPGGAWAARRDALNKIGCGLGSPLIDWNIVGGGDRSLACSLIGKIEWQMNPQYTKAYNDSMQTYQDIAVRELKKNVGYVDNTVRHMWHGRTIDRGYDSRWQILVDYQFNPLTDLAKDVSGVLRLVIGNDRQIKLRDALRKYFFNRNEDATSL